MTANVPLQDSSDQNGLQAIVADAASPDQASKQHKRTYQACEPCRNRKVRCDLGSVDAPSDPPCLRCRREKKQCYFTETRRKRKVGEPGAPELRDFGSDMRRDEHFVNGLVSRPEHLENMGVYTKAQLSHHLGQPGHAPGISQQPQIRVQGNGDEVRNDEAAELFQQPIHQPGDALRLLVDAASRTESMASKHPEIHQVPLKQETEVQPLNIDPAIMKISSHDPPDQETLRQQALQTWARLRYVRAGWFTPLEGMAYLEYFSDYLSSLTPIPTPDFSKPESHIKLLIEEPMLTVTLLTIASRYQKLSGAGGASRSIYIHSMLWQECQAMITRMFWGQEHFGGSFGLASGYRADTGEPIKRGLRGLGTVEALLLLSDWHPRSMHFPPAAGNDDILAPLQSEWEEANHVMQNRNPHQGWTEPAMRSDRMSWSLVGAAYNLALELGVFDSMPELGYFQPGYKTRAYDAARADRIGRLVHIYVSQTSGRLGYPNMLPQRNMDHDMDHEFFRMKLEPEPGEDEDDPEYVSEQMQRALCGLTGIMRRVNNEIFRSKNQTLELIQSNKYTGVLESFWPALKEWLECVEKIKLPRLARTVIMMEYEYSRTYINSLALQAQIEQYAELQNRDPSAVNGENNALFSQRLVDISKQNAPYIAEVVDSTRNLLRHVVEGLQPGGGLRHCPVRTNFRILSGAMFLLKTFALGSKEADIQQSITLLNRTVVALRTTVVDDCHLCLRIADLLASLIQWISGKFVRVPINSRPGHSKRHRASLSSNPVPARPGMEGNPESPVLGKPPISSDMQHGPGNINGIDLPFVPPLINPNDPNVVIMPPPDYMHPFPENPYVQHASPRGGNPAVIPNGYKPGAFQGQPSQATRSPTVGNAGVHPPMSFSPTPQNQQPFSPRSTGSGSGAGSYDWYAMDMGPLLHSSNGPIQPGMAANSVPWGNMLAPDIGDTLEMLGQLASDGTAFDDGMGTWATV